MQICTPVVINTTAVYLTPSLLPTATTVDGLTLRLTAQEVTSVRRATATALRFACILTSRCANGHPTSAPLSPPLTEQLVFTILKEAMASSATTFCSRAAQTWADGFTFPKEARENDANLLRQCDGDFTALCAAKRALSASGRLSEDRVRTSVRRSALTDRKDFGRLIDIARGVHIDTSPTFVPSGGINRPKMRAKYTKEVPNAVNKLLYLQWLKSTVLLIPTVLAILIMGIHFSYQHWTEKAGKAAGRNLGDTSNGERGKHTLNGNNPDEKERVRQLMIDRWGRITHPTLQDLVQMVLEAADLHGWDNIELWKMDLAAAFNLMDFDADSAKLLAFELVDGMTAIHTTGMFGWTGTPYVFQVITRVLCDLCRGVLLGLVLMYVDDMFGITLKANRQHDMDCAAVIIRQLLGHGAVAEDKSAWGRILDLLGWTFNLDTRTVTASRRNMLKAIQAFFSVDIDGQVTLEEVERMASYASRYSVLSRAMKPYTAALHADAALYKGNHHARPRRLSQLAKCAVVMWRAFLCLLRLDPANFARPLESFRKRRPTVLFEYDASLTGLGLGVSLWDIESSTFRLVAYTGVTLPYKTSGRASAYQNTKEYTAVLLGLALVRQERLVTGCFAYNVVGDNTTSLTWVKKGKAASTLARRANIGYSLLAADLDASVAEIKHIPGVLNVVYDGLSRGKKGVDLGLPAALEVVLRPDSMALRYIALCNPHLTLSTPEEHISLSNKMLALLGPRPPHSN